MSGIFGAANAGALRQFAETDLEKRTLDLIERHGSISEVARQLGRHRTSVSKTFSRLRARAALRGYAPEHDMTHIAPGTHIVRGASTLYDAEGRISAQWVKTDLNREQAARAAREFIEALAEDVRPARGTKAPKHADDELAVVYPIGDPHIGMYSWHEETGADFDLAIAAADLDAAMSEITRAAPKAETAVIVNLGDYFHADDATSRTPKSDHVLDVDGRFGKVIRVGCQILVGLVAHALRRHQRVILRCESGNHDPHAALWLPVVMQAYFRHEPRVEVVMDPTPFWYFRHGKTLIGTTHGHGPKPHQLAGVMATDRPQDWGETEHRMWVHGHIHSTTRHEFPGCVVESFRTLAGKDYWHTQQGYRSARDLNALVLHREWGEVARHRVGITQARESAR